MIANDTTLAHAPSTDSPDPPLSFPNPSADSLVNLLWIDPPKWGWSAIGGVVDLLPPHERARRKQEREAFFRKQSQLKKREQDQLEQLVLKNQHIALNQHETTSTVASEVVAQPTTEAPDSEQTQQDRAEVPLLLNSNVSTITSTLSGAPRPLRNQAVHVDKEAAPTGVDKMQLRFQLGEQGTESNAKGSSPNAPAASTTGSISNHTGAESEAERLEYNTATKLPCTSNIDSYYPNLVSGKEPRHDYSGHLLPNNLLTTVMDTNHLWDPNTVVKLTICFPLTDDDDDMEDCVGRKGGGGSTYFCSAPAVADVALVYDLSLEDDEEESLAIGANNDDGSDLENSTAGNEGRPSRQSSFRRSSASSVSSLVRTGSSGKQLRRQQSGVSAGVDSTLHTRKRVVSNSTSNADDLSSRGKKRSTARCSSGRSRVSDASAIPDKTDDSEKLNLSSAVTKLDNKEYFEEVIDWDLGDPATPTPAAFATQTALEYGLSMHQTMDLQACIESQIYNFVQTKLNYKPPISVREPLGMMRSDDENYATSHVVQKSTSVSASRARFRSSVAKRQSSSSSLNPTETQSRKAADGRRRSGGATTPPTPRMNHSLYFKEKVIEKLKIESSICNKANEKTNGGKISYVANGVCHICHFRRPSTVFFGCGITQHGYCDNHCCSRLGFSIEDAKRGQSEVAKSFDGGYCPVCALVCICAKCLRKADSIFDDVAHQCLAVKNDTYVEKSSDGKADAATTAQVEGRANSTSALDQSGEPINPVDKLVAKVVESMDLLADSLGRKPVDKPVMDIGINPKIDAPIAATVVDRSALESVRPNRKRQRDGISKGEGLTTSTRSRQKSCAHPESIASILAPNTRIVNRRNRRPPETPHGQALGSAFPYELCEGKLTNLPKNMNEEDVKITTDPCLEDANIDYCFLCKESCGDVVCCDECPRAFHFTCLQGEHISDHWRCPLCIRDSHPLESDCVSGEECFETMCAVLSSYSYIKDFSRYFKTCCKLYEIVLRLMKFDFGDMFSTPVCFQAVTNYLSIVKQPMDLGTVAHNIVNGIYTKPLDSGAYQGVMKVTECSTSTTEHDKLDSVDASAEAVPTKGDNAEHSYCATFVDVESTPMHTAEGIIDDHLHGLNNAILSILKDTELIWHNCFLFNHEASSIHRMAEVQRRKFLSFVECSVVEDLDDVVVTKLEEYVKGLERSRRGGGSDPTTGNARCIQVIYVPQSKGGKQKRIVVVDPITNKTIQIYSTITRALMASSYLERRGHKTDICPLNLYTFKNMLKEGSKDASVKLFGYRWLFESDYDIESGTVPPRNDTGANACPPRNSTEECSLTPKMDNSSTANVETSDSPETIEVSLDDTGNAKTPRVETDIEHISESALKSDGSLM